MIQNRQKIDYLTFARGFSILTIVLYHFLQRMDLGRILSEAIKFGGTGVHLFILLSGFGLTLSHSQGLKEYYRNRFLKILIPYYVLVVIAATINFFVPIYKDAGFYVQKEECRLCFATLVQSIPPMVRPICQE